MVFLKDEKQLKKHLKEGSRSYLYGAGKVYRKIIAAINEDIIAVIDKNHLNIKPLTKVEIVPPDSVFSRDGVYDVVCALDPEFDYLNRALRLSKELEKYDAHINMFLIDLQKLEEDGIIVWGERNLLYDNRKYLISGKSDFVCNAYLPEVVADADYLTKLNEEPYAFVIRDTGIGFEDFDNGLIVHANGRKDWGDRNKKYDNRILLFGDSRVSGMLLENKHTIAAELQKRIDENCYLYRVNNYAIPGRDIERMVWQIKNTELEHGDVVVLASGFYEFENPDTDVLVWTDYIEEACEYTRVNGAYFFYINLPTMLEVTNYSEDEKKALNMFNSTEFLDYTPEKIAYYKNIIQMECASRRVCFIDMASAFAYRNEYGQVWINLHHYGPHGSRLIADELMKYVTPLTKYKDNAFLYERAEVEKKNRSKKFEEKLKKMRDEDEQIYIFADNLREHMLKKWGNYEEVGCIVMNANPFTKGHMFLVDEALKRVNKLLVLVVEENLSEISFKHRYQIVIENLAEKENVFVAPSGAYTISKSTFPDYFVKEAIQGKKINAEPDVRVFAERIAPRVGIRKRFVGEEPFDEITRQYNETMKSVFCGYGIELIEIPRLNIDEKIVSATTVRECIRNGKIEEIAEFLTPRTYDYLLTHEVFLR